MSLLLALLGGGAGAFTLTASPAIVAVSGQSVGLRAARKLTVSPGIVAVAGNQVVLRAGYRISVSPATVAIVGQSIALRSAYRLAVSPATAAIIGQSVSLRSAHTLTVSPATVAISGQSIVLRAAHTLAASPATVAIAGQSVSLRCAYRLVASPATIPIAGQDVALRAAYRLAISPSTVAITGQSVTLTFTGTGYSIAVSPASVTISGQNVGLAAGYRIAVTQQTVAIAGQSVNLTFTGVAAAAYTLIVSPATIAFAGQSVAMSYAWRVLPPGPFALTGGRGMGYSRTSIGNLALAHLADRRINDIDDNNDDNAVALKDNYDHAKNLTFSAHEWRWGRKQTELQQSLPVPVARYNYAYSLPGDFSRICNISENITMEPALDDWDIAGGKLITNAAFCYVEYVSNTFSEGVWPAYFAACVAGQLAILSCPRISHNMNVLANLQSQFDSKTLPQARVTDSQFQPPRRRVVRSQWTPARFGGGFSGKR